MTSAPTVADLQKKIHQGTGVDEYIDGQITGFDHIINAYPTRYGRNVIKLALPTAPDIAGLERSDAQRVLYAKLIGIYCHRGFDARIKMDASRADLLLFFDVAIEPSLDVAISNLIRARELDTTTDEGKKRFSGLLKGTEPLHRDIPHETSKWLHLPRRPAESSMGPAAAEPAPAVRPMRPPKQAGGAGGPSGTQ